MYYSPKNLIFDFLCLGMKKSIVTLLRHGKRKTKKKRKGKDRNTTTCSEQKIDDRARN